MAELTPTLTWAALLGLISVVLFKLTRASSKPTRPGPPGKPFFGNALDIPKQAPWLKFTEWGTTYGDIVFAKVFTRKLVIVHSYDLAIQLFEKRSANYANRPRRYMAELSGFGKAMLFKNYGEDVKKGRKLIHAGLGAVDSQAFQAMHTASAHKFAKLLLDDPTRWRRHLRRMVTANLLRFAYGHKVENDDDFLVPLSEKIMVITGKVVSPNRYVIDTFPFLNNLPEWFPGTGFKQVAKRYKVLLDQLIETPFLKVKADMRNGTAEPSFTSYHLEGKLDTMSEEDQELLQWTSGIINAAGVDTSASILSSFFLAMVRNQDVQAKAQQELDAVLGPDVLPTFADRPRLPFIECLMKESFRWHPPTPLIARSLKTDDVVNGCEVKAGSFLVANIWAYTHDPNLYPDPFEFTPSRFLPTPQGTPLPPDPRLYIFGFGRRRCPGSELADNGLYMMMTTVLALFKILPEVGGDGEDVMPPVEYTTTLTCHPVPFKCRIVPRSREAVKLIQYVNENES
ncbi:cytochrome P450 [Lyophyllum atratum]|nr:cytochrome P450 [Lyophyllum atratum]